MEAHRTLPITPVCQLLVPSFSLSVHPRKPSSMQAVASVIHVMPHLAVSFFRLKRLIDSQMPVTGIFNRLSGCAPRTLDCLLILTGPVVPSYSTSPLCPPGGTSSLIPKHPSRKWICSTTQKENIEYEHVGSGVCGDNSCVPHSGVHVHKSCLIPRIQRLQIGPSFEVIPV
jgi:hypothetical protein